jgi:hypothetical protein
MATIRAAGGGGLPDQVALSTAQTGNAVSTNIVDRLPGGLEPAIVEIVSTVGATPTVTVDVQGSMDGASWFNIAYAPNSPIAALAIAALVITTAVTNRLFLPVDQAWRFLRCNYSANTNVTLSTTAWIL